MKENNKMKHIYEMCEKIQEYIDNDMVSVSISEEEYTKIYETRFREKHGLSILRKIIDDMFTPSVMYNKYFHLEVSMKSTIFAA